MVSAWVLGWSGRVNRPFTLPSLSTIARAEQSDVPPTAHEAEQPDVEKGDASIRTPPTVMLSIEPTAAVSGGDTEVSVVLPGYVLPDDSFQEPAHEGS
jgi:hypothetical protein